MIRTFWVSSHFQEVGLQGSVVKGGVVQGSVVRGSVVKGSMVKGSVVQRERGRVRK
jgi:hypothetical protein